jgi:hypothetical protein
MRLVFLIGLFLAATALSFGQTKKADEAAKSAQKKMQHIKVVVNQDGKEVKIDTTFNLLDEKVVQFKVDSIMKKLEKEGIGLGDSKVIIMKGGDNHTFFKHLPGKDPLSDEHFDVVFQSNDSGKVKHERRIIHINKGGKMMTIDSDGDMVPPPPPPPMPPYHVRSLRMFGGDPYAHDPDNKDIISYDKKDIGKGLEKITIVRKKQSTIEHKKDVEVNVEVTDDTKKK